MKTSSSKSVQPFSPQEVNRFLLVIIIILAIFSGYFHARYSNEERKYGRLLEKYLDLKESTSPTQ